LLSAKDFLDGDVMLFDDKDFDTIQKEGWIWVKSKK
jgi:hypothetical protein